MFCPKCGTYLNPLAAFCSKCGHRSAGNTLSPPDMTRPTAITILAVLQFISGGLCALMGGAIGLGVLASSRSAQAEPGAPMAAAIVIGITVAVAAYQIVCGVGLWRLRSYGRIMQIIGAVVGLLGIPVGTIISIVVLVYLMKPGIKVLFSGKTPQELTPEESAAVHSVTSGGGGGSVVIIVVALAFFMVFAIGIIAAIAVPGLLRARISGNEAVTIGALRAISSAETSYAVANGGYYDSQECLVTPSNCLPDYRDTPFLAEAYHTKSGYHFELSGSAPPAERDSKTSRTSLSGFIVIAVPLSPSTGTRMFCLDDTGAIRWQPGQNPIPPGLTQCPAAWRPIE